MNQFPKIKTILIGTPSFTENIFSKFYNALKDKFEIIAVVTAEDKPIGRKQILTPPPIKKWAVENNLPVLQPEKINAPEWIKKIKELNPDLIILAAYGQIIPKEILDILSPRSQGKYGALNIHPSLLPKYRGASPIQTAILNGDKETGVTIILMDEKTDHGDIVAKLKVKSQKSKVTYKELSDKLADAGAELLVKILPDWIAGKIKPKPQDHSRAIFTKIIKKEDGKIDWNKSAEEIERQIRALNPWPGTHTEIKNSKLKILEADPSTTLGASKKIGEVFLRDEELTVQTGNGILIIKQLQLEGKKPMPIKDFLNGHPEIVGAILK